jgi:hypothetical protein
MGVDLEAFHRVLAALSSVKTPITVTALTIVVFYYLVNHVLSLSVFVNLTQTDTGVVLQSILSKVFWLALAGLAFGALLFALPYILPNRRAGHVDLVSADVNPNLSNYSASPKDDSSISKRE